MGLDGVELVMEVEDHFDLSLANAEAESLRTVGDLVAIIQSRVQMAKEKPCLALSFFVKLRRCVRNVNGDDRFRIRPKDRVSDRLSPGERRVLWQHVERQFGYSLCPLRRPRWLRWVLNLAAVAMLSSACVYGLSIDLVAVPVMLVWAVLGIIVLNGITAPLRTEPRENWSTFGDITLRLVESVATTRTDLTSTDEILAELRPIIAKQLGVNPALVVPSARFVEDLGMS